jgi:hypothetical protein
MSKAYVLIIAFVISVWLVAMSGVALHEASTKPGESYTNFVKWFSGISIAVGSLTFLFASYSLYEKFENKS